MTAPAAGATLVSAAGAVSATTSSSINSVIPPTVGHGDRKDGVHAEREEIHRVLVEGRRVELVDGEEHRLAQLAQLDHQLAIDRVHALAPVEDDDDRVGFLGRQQTLRPHRGSQW